MLHTGSHHAQTIVVTEHEHYWSIAQIYPEQQVYSEHPRSEEVAISIAARKAHAPATIVVIDKQGWARLGKSID